MVVTVRKETFRPEIKIATIEKNRQDWGFDHKYKSDDESKKKITCEQQPKQIDIFNATRLIINVFIIIVQSWRDVEKLKYLSSASLVAMAWEPRFAAMLHMPVFA